MSETSTASVLLRAPSFRGSVLVAGFVADVALLGEAEARARILAMLAPGVTVERSDARYLVLLPQPRRLAVDAAPLTPLVRVGGWLSAAPLTPSELRALGPPRADAFVDVRAGRAHVAARGADASVDLADWLDVAGFTCVAVRSLGAPPAALRPAVAPPHDDTRAVFGDAVPPLDPAAAQLREALLAAARPSAGGGARAGSGAPDARGGTAQPTWLAVALVQLLRVAALALTRIDVLATWLGLRLPRASAPAPGRATPGAGKSTPSEPPAPSRLAQLWSDLVARVKSRLLASRLGAVVARRQAEYLARLVELLDRGDLDGALRSAIPLAGDSAPSAGVAHPAMSVPTARTSFEIGVSANGPAGSISVPPGVYELLRERYRRLFERLDAAGRHAEAAFVLAELLHDSPAAVAYLERAGRKRLAAELAESRKLAMPLVVRQWLIAGDTSRALLLARKHDVVSEVLARLRGKEPILAAMFALHAADARASVGDFLGAIALARPEQSAHGLVLAWSEQALGVGGVTAARALALRVTLAPEAWQETLGAVRALLTEDGADTAQTRLAFARALLTEPSSPLAATLARHAVRALLRDQGDAVVGARAEITGLLRLADDPALRADLPAALAASAPAQRTDGTKPRVLNIARDDVGITAIRDAALLSSGRLLVGAGEAGVFVLARDGRVIARLDAPCDELAVSDDDTRAIAIARRGDVVRLTRLDLANLRAAVWTEARLSSVARTFDGDRWWVGTHDGALVSLDVTADTLSSFERIEQVWPMWIDRSEKHAMHALCGRDEASLELWRYNGRVPVLASRRAISAFVTPGHALSAHSADFTFVVEYPIPDAASGTESAGVQDERRHSLTRTHPRYSLPLDGEPVALLPMARDHVIVPLRSATRGLCVELRRAVDAAETARLELGGAERVSLRIAGDLLVVGDDRGRLLVVSIESGDVVRDVRLRP